MPRPLPARVIPVAAAVAVAAAAPLVLGAQGAVTERESIASGDTVTGDALFPGDFDEYLFDAPRGARVALTYRRLAPGNWAPYVGVFGREYAPSYGMIVTPRKLTSDPPLRESGPHRMIVSSLDGTAGAFEVRMDVLPGRKFTAPAPGDATPATLDLGALANSSVSVAISWRGAAPVTLESLAGPDGPVVSASAPRTTRRGSTQSGFRTTATGDLVATFAVPPGTARWSAQVNVAPPAFPAGRRIDVRTTGVPAPPPADVLPSGQYVGFAVAGERGGPNDLLLSPHLAAPATLAATSFDPRSAGCGTGTVETVPEPGTYFFRCLNGWSADIGSIVRTRGPDDVVRITAFAADVRTPGGTGRITVADIAYDPADGRPATWTETRRYDATGRTHVVRVLEVTRFPATDPRAGQIFALTFEHRAPDGTTRTIDWTALSLNVR